MFVAALLIGAAQTPATNGSLEGIVRNAATREPLADVDVTLQEGGESIVAAMRHAVRTNAQGFFSLKDVAPGRYDLQARRAGYLSTNDDAWWETEIHVDSQQAIRNLVVELMPASSINGRIWNSEGEPVPGVRVQAAEPRYMEGFREVDRGPSATTDEQGRYRIFGLLPGEYHLRAEYTPRHPGLETDTVLYPGTFDESAGKPVIVPAGAELTGMDFVFPKPVIRPTFTVAGMVVGVPSATDRKSTPTVRLMPPDGGLGPRDPRLTEYSVRARSSGEFQFRGVRAGKYDLIAWVEDEKRNLFSSTTPIEIGGNIENLQITLQRGVDLPVRVTLNGGAPRGAFEDAIPELNTLAGIFPTYRNELFSTLEGYKADNNSGEYILPQIPPGRYRLSYWLRSVENSIIADIQQGGRSVFDDGFTVDTRTAQPIEIAITTTGGKVEGTVRDANGKPAPPATVVVMPLAERRDNPALFRGTLSDKDGRFTIGSVAPGEYKIFAWAKAPFGEPWRNAEFMAQYEQRGQSIRVMSNSTSTVQVTVLGKAGL